MTARATARGPDRSSLEGTTVDVLICGASFAGLAVARELAGHRADVLLVDRYEIGERQTSACAAPTLWLEAMGASGAIVQEIPNMRFTTPHGQVRCRLPWTWSSFDYRHLCEILHAQSDARFVTAKVRGMAPGATGGPLLSVMTDRGVIQAGIVVDALGWRRVLSAGGYQPPDAPLSRGLEVHPKVAPDDLRPKGDLDVWIDRSLVDRGYGWRVPAGTESRIGVGSYRPTDHVKQPTIALARRLGAEAVHYQGNWFPHRLREATEGEVFFVGDSAGHCFALSGEGIRTAFYFGAACGREIAAAIDGRCSRGQALSVYRAFHARHRRGFAIASALQAGIPRIHPRLLTAILAVIGRPWIVDRAFSWYLDQAHPSFMEHADPPLVERSRPAYNLCP